ncbi:SDR family NAD(P)-dependent oxidoreductase [Paenibacillus riograndensis]|uniref:Short-chain dehydrogenase/reductase SDR n=1 Tax=Paenibacillus riograndensis SBR5 TaxID=1073571 RepID=A0A0E4CYL3_9BACL|nr:SDR family NAD(P)-dependent oxidoreductase [Paenibacillus riograndensis]CQR57624.1 hypothetical protein PRIO_5225 [Paenibacillus riograndensis SBR5]
MDQIQRVGIVTGGASGIGKALCKELLKRRVYIVIADLNAEEGVKTVAELEGLGGACRFVQVDVADGPAVGLTASLHYEAEAYGVKVSCLCPAFVDTPIFDSGEAVHMDKKKVLAQVKKQKLMTPEHFAGIAFKGIERNEELVNPMPLRRTMDVVFTLFPSLHRKVMRLVCRTTREARLS